MSKVMNSKIHKDCPFTEDEILTFYDMLYNVNTGHHCANPAPSLWSVGSQMFEQVQQNRKHENIIDELERLRKENEELKNDLESFIKQK